jgi:hypothetical protein
VERRVFGARSCSNPKTSADSPVQITELSVTRER